MKSKTKKKVTKKTTTKKINSKLIPALITTDRRGVFMAYIDRSDIGQTSIKVKDIRMCVKWTEDVKGVIGLAATGPTSGCRITKAGDNGIIHGVTAIIELNKESEKKWLSEPWG